MPKLLMHIFDVPHVKIFEDQLTQQYKWSPKLISNFDIIFAYKCDPLSLSIQTAG